MPPAEEVAILTAQEHNHPIDDLKACVSLDEVLGLADRIAVMFRGRIIGEVPAGTSAGEIGLLMAGSTTDAPPAGPAAQKAEGAP